MYQKIRKAAIISFIVCMVAAAIIVIFAIWGIFANDVIGKSFSSLAILVVSSALIGIATLIREGKANLTSSPNVASQIPGTMPTVSSPDISVGRVILYVVLALIALPLVFSFIVGMAR